MLNKILIFATAIIIASVFLSPLFIEFAQDEQATIIIQEEKQ